jgi:crotonobetainyl-CoA:carnitine CoA-transferase CaiB-like acyl-CoA transferase
MRFSATPVEYRLAPPLLGQHNQEIFADLLGRSQADLEALRAAGTIS